MKSRVLVVLAVACCVGSGVAFAKNGSNLGSPSQSRTATAAQQRAHLQAQQQRMAYQQQALSQQQAAATNRSRQQNQWKGGNGTGAQGQGLKQRDQKRDGSCLLNSTSSGTQDQIRQRDQLKKKDGSCQ